MTKILIVDDEKIARDRIRRFLGESSRAVDICEAANGLEALEAIAEFRPEVVFLDIQMPELTGFDVLQQVETRDFQIVFQTAFDEFALKAFDEAAVDYLLKPFTQERFEKALERALVTGRVPSPALSSLDSSLKSGANYLTKLTYRARGERRILDTAKILCFTSEDHCTIAHTIDGEHVIDVSLTHLEERLNPRIFVRTHRNSIAAVDQIESIGGTEDSYVALKGGRQLPLSRSARKEVLTKFQGK